MLLSKGQRTGAIILLSLALAGWLIAALRTRRETESIPPREPNTHKLSWEQRKDSMRRADSARFAEWAAEREQRYDSFRLADSLRRAEWKAERKRLFDSSRIADSIWRDSVGWRFGAKHVKRDTILDLNHCDTSELQLIRGIGRYTAVRIVKYREELGGYYSPVQLGDEELGKLRLDTLFAHFTADPSDIQTINVNTCPLEVLQRHPYLRYNQAKAIYTLRRKKVRLRSIEALREVKEMSEREIERVAPYLRFE